MTTTCTILIFLHYNYNIYSISYMVVPLCVQGFMDLFVLLHVQGVISEGFTSAIRAASICVYIHTPSYLTFLCTCTYICMCHVITCVGSPERRQLSFSVVNSGSRGVLPTSSSTLGSVARWRANSIPGHCLYNACACSTCTSLGVLSTYYFVMLK